LEKEEEGNNISTHHICTQLSKYPFSLFNQEKISTHNGRRIEEKGVSRGRKERDNK